MPENKDQYLYGLVPKLKFRFAYCDLSYTTTTICNLHNLGDREEAIMSETIVGAFTLADMVKEEAKVSLQIQFYEDSSLHSVLAYSNRKGSIKATVRFRPEENIEPEAASMENSGLMKVFRWKDGKCVYQSVVPFRKEPIANNLMRFLNESEQIKAFLLIRHKKEGFHWNVQGLFLQALPDATEEDVSHIRDLVDSLQKDKEMYFASSDSKQILKSINELHGWQFEVLEEGHPHFQCDCSKEKILQIVEALGQPEADSIVEEYGKIEVTCEFCNSVYTVEPKEVDSIFSKG